MKSPNLSFQQFTRIIEARGNFARIPVRPASAPPGAEAADGGWSHGDASRMPPRLVSAGRPKGTRGRFGQWLLFVGPKSTWYLLDNIIATLALHEEVRVLDCGSQVDRRHLHSLLKRHPQAFERIKILKAHSAQEAVYLLDHISSIPVPFITLDLLRPFYETSTPLKERKEMLKACFQNLRRLRQHPSAQAGCQPGGEDAVRAGGGGGEEHVRCDGTLSGLGDAEVVQEGVGEAGGLRTSPSFASFSIFKRGKWRGTRWGRKMFFLFIFFSAYPSC
jgi:hypothetical protein